jgi:hypothetical protein
MRFLPWRRTRPGVVQEQHEAEHALARAQVEGERVEELAVEMTKISARNSFTESFRLALSPPPRHSSGPTC